MSVPNTFASATGSLPLSQLDSNFGYYDAAFQISGTEMLVNYTFKLEDVTDNTKVAQFVLSGITTATTRSYTMPNASGTFALLGLAQTWTATQTYSTANFRLTDSTDTTKIGIFDCSQIATSTSRVYTFPNSSGTFPLLGLAQTWTATQTFNAAISSGNFAFTWAGTTTNFSVNAGQTSGTIVIGGTSGTGAITVGQSTSSQTLNLATGATTNLSSKTINIGTNGVSGSVTTINIGSATSGATGKTSINSEWTGVKGFGATSPVTVNAATHVVASTTYSLIVTNQSCVFTLPSAAGFPGRILIFNNTAAVSATTIASIVVPLGSTTAGTSILPATAGKFAMLQSDGTNWITLMAN